MAGLPEATESELGLMEEAAQEKLLRIATLRENRRLRDRVDELEREVGGWREFGILLPGWMDTAKIVASLRKVEGLKSVRDRLAKEFGGTWFEALARAIESSVEKRIRTA